MGAFEAAARARRRRRSPSSFPSSSSSSAFSASPALAYAAARLRAAARDPSRPGKHIDACLLSLEEAAARAEREEEGGEGEEEEAGAGAAAATTTPNGSEEAKAAPPATPPRLDLVERLAARVAAARLEALAAIPQDGERQQPMEEDEKKEKEGRTPSAAATAAASSALRRLGRLLGCGASCSDDRALSLASCSAAAAQKISRSLPEGLESAGALDRGAFSKQQLSMLDDVDGALREEYRLRRRLLAGRAEVTLRALLASPRLAKDAETLKYATGAAESALERMGAEPAVEEPSEGGGEREGGGRGVWGVSAGDILSLGARTSATAARRPSDALTAAASASASATEDSSLAAVKRVVVAAVPDRGGRVNEPRGGRGGAAAGPAWAARVEGGGGGGGGSKPSKKHRSW